MNLIALSVGITSSFYILYRFKKTGLEKSRWAYALFIATYPLYYLCFALYGQDYKTFSYEIIVGLLIIIFAYVGYRLKRRSALFFLGLLSISHALYDYMHEELFINAGTPVWWTEFCGSIDIILGLYLLFLAFKSR